MINVSDQSLLFSKFQVLANNLCGISISDFINIKKHFNASINTEWCWYFSCTAVAKRTSKEEIKAAVHLAIDTEVSFQVLNMTLISRKTAM